jgi:hypothetical protein
MQQVGQPTVVNNLELEKQLQDAHRAIETMQVCDSPYRVGLQMVIACGMNCS